MICVVVPVFNESELVHQLHAAIAQAMDSIGCPWRVVYVDDGSRDDTCALLRGLQADDARITVLELSRNWGHQAALTAGLAAAADADAVVLIDGDLQDPPAVIPRLVAAWRDGAEVVVAERTRRAERGLRGLLFRSFYRVFGFLSDYPIPLNAGIFGLLDKKAVAAVNRLSETNRYLPGLRAWVGFRTAVVSYERAARAAGEPKQSFRKLVSYALDAVFSFSYKPLRLSLCLGSLFAGFAMFYGVVLLVARLLGKGLFGLPVVDGYTSTIVSILFLGGVQLISVGILGEYIGRVYDEVKRRPLFLVRATHEANTDCLPPVAPSRSDSAERQTCQVG
jgi:dolichol-phosphate mannosyltransferase